METLFHEFGHILHQVLTTADLVRFSGSSTERDLVEAPSQIMEHWTWQPAVTLRPSSRDRRAVPSRVDRGHGGGPEPQHRPDHAAPGPFRVLDMGLHGEGATERDLDGIHRAAIEVALLPPHEGTFFPASFGHMLGGYDAGNYGHLWSEVYGDDMFGQADDTTEGLNGRKDCCRFL